MAKFCLRIDGPLSGIHFVLQLIFFPLVLNVGSSVFFSPKQYYYFWNGNLVGIHYDDKVERVRDCWRVTLY